MSGKVSPDLPCQRGLAPCVCQDAYMPPMVQADPSLMFELLNAATRTALAHRNDPNEMYVLGQLEATANVLYVIAVSQGFDALEASCQRIAQEALTRLMEISSRSRGRAANSPGAGNSNETGNSLVPLNSQSL